MRAWLVVALVAGCGDGKSSGEPCERSIECEGECHEGRCRSRYAQLGDPCNEDRSCDFDQDLDCWKGRCVGPGKLGEECSGTDRSCASGLFCVKESCVGKGTLGQWCSRDTRASDFRLCETSLTCFDNRCLDDVEGHKREVRLAAEKRMLEASGAAMPAAEGPAKPADEPARHPGVAVRVVEIENAGFAIAACRADERMIGGGCEGAGLEANRPAAFSGSDTVGARWECRSADRKAEVTAFALCTALPGR